MRARLRPDLVAQHAEAFLTNGDMNSNLYTSSRAMHSAVLGLLAPEGSGLARAGVGRLQNLSLSVQRRWANVLSDATRQVGSGLRVQGSGIHPKPRHPVYLGVRRHAPGARGVPRPIHPGPLGWTALLRCQG